MSKNNEMEKCKHQPESPCKSIKLMSRLSGRGMPRFCARNRDSCIPDERLYIALLRSQFYRRRHGLISVIANVGMPEGAGQLEHGVGVL